MGGLAQGSQAVDKTQPSRGRCWAGALWGAWVLEEAVRTRGKQEEGASLRRTEDTAPQPEPPQGEAKVPDPRTEVTLSGQSPKTQQWQWERGQREQGQRVRGQRERGQGSGGSGSGGGGSGAVGATLLTP